MLLGIGEFLLRFPDSRQCLVKTVYGRLPDTIHRTATVEDDYVMYLCLYHVRYLIKYSFTMNNDKGRKVNKEGRFLFT